jgi:hypothetical protein
MKRICMQRQRRLKRLSRQSRNARTQAEWVVSAPEPAPAACHESPAEGQLTLLQKSPWWDEQKCKRQPEAECEWPARLEKPFGRSPGARVETRAKQPARCYALYRALVLNFGGKS